MSTFKKNALAAALVAGLGMAGAAAAYNYGTAAFGPAATTGDTSATSPAGLWVPENVAYQMLIGPAYNYTMTEDLVFDIQIPDNAVQVTTGFTVRVMLNRNNCVPSGLPYPQPDITCSDTADGALFNTANIPTAGTGAGQLELNATLISAGWTVAFDGYYDGGRTASIRIIPPAGNTANPGPGEMLRWHNPQLTSLNEFATGATNKVDAEFWMVNATNDARFQGSTTSRTILNRVSGVNACADDIYAEVDKYIDVADNFLEDQIPKTRFSFDGKLGSANDSNNIGFGAGRTDQSQTINLGDVTITNTGAGNSAFLGTDNFTTVISGGAGDNWAAFENGPTPFNDDVYLVDGTCASGTIVAQGNISGNSVTFVYTAASANLPLTPGASTKRLTVCAFNDTNIVIDDHVNQVVTTFFRANAVPTPAFNGASCKLLPLRYNGSTMEIFTINPASNTTQRSFIRLTNRSTTDGYVALDGIDNAGMHGAQVVRVWVPAGQSVQLDASDLENGTNGAIGAWGAPTNGKWRAVVTAEFPGLVASSLVNSALPRVLTNITPTDTRGSQIERDWAEGSWGSDPGQRPADFAQEFEPDFTGNGSTTGGPTGPNGNDGPSGGTTDAPGNPGL